MRGVYRVFTQCIVCEWVYGYYWRADGEKKDIDERRLVGSTEGTQAKIPLLLLLVYQYHTLHLWQQEGGIEKPAKAKRTCFIKIRNPRIRRCKECADRSGRCSANCIGQPQQMPKFPWRRSMVKSDRMCYPTESVNESAVDGSNQWGDAPVYHAAAGSRTSSAGNKSGGSVGHKIYMQRWMAYLLMLPLVVDTVVSWSCYVFPWSIVKELAI